MMLKLYTNKYGIELLKEGYSAYAWNFKNKSEAIPFLVSSHNAKLVRIHESGDMVQKFFLVEGDSKISIVNE